jgi:hypothetical protein
MKKRLFILAALLNGIAAFAQVSNPSIVAVSSAPSGSCTNGLPNQQVISTGVQYSCQGGTWGAIGGSGSFNALTGDAISTATGGATTVQGLKGVPFCTGFTPTNGQSIQYTTASSPNPCYTAATVSGGGSSVNVNGGTTLPTVALTNNTGAGEIDFTNPSGATVNATLHNTTTTVNSQSCALGGTCTIPIQTNSSNNTSQAGINLETSTTNSVGLTVTPTNSATNVEKFEITGPSYTGNAATATNLASYPTLCSGGQFSQGLSSGSNNCGTPSGGGSGTVSGQAAGVIPLGTSSTAISNQSHLDDGNTTAGVITSSEPVAVASDGVHAGVIAVIGNTTLPSLQAGSFNLLGPNSASVTAYAWQMPTATNGSAGVALIGANSSNVSQVTVGTVPNSDLTNSAITIAGTSVALGSSTSSLPSPGAIGGTTPAAITGTAITANTSLTINGGTAQTGTQGTDTKLLTAGTVSGTAATLCTDANGGATTTGCSSGGGGSITGSGLTQYSVYNITAASLTPADTWGFPTAGSTATISIATPAVITVTNNAYAGMLVSFGTTSALPTGITAGTPYCVIASGLSTSSFEISPSCGGSAVNTSGTQAGTQTIYSGTQPGFTFTNVPANCVAATTTACNTAGNIVTNPSWTWTLGLPIYVSDGATPGVLTQTAPTASGHFVDVVGYPVSATSILIQPDSRMTVIN